jgi:hypothetical protein
MELADGGNKMVWILDHAAGQILSGFGQPGNFSHVHTISINSKGNLIAGETINGRRVQRFKLSGYQPAETMPAVRREGSAPQGASDSKPED